MISPSFVLLSLLPSLVLAANDWSQPCLQGVCSYDLAPNANQMAATMTINGSPKAISDITVAAGWEILGCDPKAMSQNVRLVCKSDDTTAAGCDHLYQGGAVDTIVRLPESCGKGPFARVAKAWVPKDQSIPASVARRLVRRQNAPPEVKALALDTNFAAAGAPNGNVTLAIQGSSIPGAVGNATVTPAASRRSTRMLQSRGFGSFINGILDGFKNLDSFNKDVSTQLPPIDINKSFPIFSASADCGGAAKASVDISADAKAHAEVTLGVVAAGTIIPPLINDFAIYSGLSATLDGTLKIVASASGAIDSGLLPLFEVGIPGLDFPGILTIGPSFKLNAQAKANLDVDLNMAVDLNYNIPKLQLFFPPSSNHPSQGSLDPKDSPVKLSVAGNVASKGTVEAHLIPTLDVGINALSGVAKAVVFLNLDAAAILELTLNANAGAAVGSDGTKDASASANGCVNLHGGLSSNAGASGSFLGLFDATTQVPIFTKNFEIFQKCFGATTSPKRALPALLVPVKRASPLQCLTSQGGALASLIDQTVAASGFKAI